MKSRIKKLNLPKKLANLLPKNAMDDVSRADVQHNTKVIQHYINHARANLDALKTTIFDVIDAGYADLDATGFATLPRAHTPTSASYELDPDARSLIEPVNGEEKASIFLERAYAVQTDDNNTANRYPDYISAGIALHQYCEAKSDEPRHPDLLILNDAGKMIAAINGTLSQLNRIEGYLARRDYEHLAGVLPALPQYIQEVVETAKQSKFINNAANSTFSLNNPLASISKFFSNLLKSKQQLTIERFKELKSAYGSNQDETTPSTRPSTPPPSGH